MISCFIYTDSKHHLCNIRILSRIILTYTTVSRQQIYIFPVKCFFEDSLSSCCLAEDISLITPSWRLRRSRVSGFRLGSELSSRLTNSQGMVKLVHREQSFVSGYFWHYLGRTGSNSLLYFTAPYGAFCTAFLSTIWWGRDLVWANRFYPAHDILFLLPVLKSQGARSVKQVSVLWLHMKWIINPHLIFMVTRWKMDCQVQKHLAIMEFRERDSLCI